MKKETKSKVVLGAVYKNSYGDFRIPIICEVRDIQMEGFNFGGFNIFYIEKRNDSRFYSYNPHVNMITEKQFLSKFFPQVNELMLDQSEIDSLEEILIESDEKWQQNYKDTAVSLLGAMSRIIVKDYEKKRN